MQIIRAGKVVFTDETSITDTDSASQDSVLTRVERSRMAAYAAQDTKDANERELIASKVATLASFKHTEPKSIYSPSGRVLNQFVAPKYKQPRHRQGHWAPYDRA